MRPQRVAVVPVFPASDHAEDVTGCTVGIAGGNRVFVSEPERSLTEDVSTEGPWTAAEVGDRWDELTEGFETTLMSPSW